MWLTAPGDLRDDAALAQTAAVAVMVVLVPLGSLAIACMAYDADMPVEVKSEYIPRAPLGRSWVGEYYTR